MTNRLTARVAKYKIGQWSVTDVFPFPRSRIDVDPIFDNTDEWYESIPAEMPAAQGSAGSIICSPRTPTPNTIAYVSEQNLLPDQFSEPIRHPQVAEVFTDASAATAAPTA
jgi:heat shock protein HspQ